jgi:hypothetical protein
LPSSWGSTALTLLEAPVECGIMLLMMDLWVLFFLLMTSTQFWLPVVAWMVVKNALLTPNASLMMRSAGAMQFVVHEEALTTYAREGKS